MKDSPLLRAFYSAYNNKDREEAAYGLIAQLDRAAAFEAACQAFESP
jgi:hypothetical protein